MSYKIHLGENEKIKVCKYKNHPAGVVEQMPINLNAKRIHLDFKKDYGDLVSTEYLIFRADQNSLGIFTEFIDDKFNKSYFYSNILSVGMPAVYDRYNLIYTGDIIKITNKQVHIYEKMNKGIKKLDLYRFCKFNALYDPAHWKKHNNEMSMQI